MKIFKVMKHVNLNEKIAKIEEFCSTNNISLFKGSVPETDIVVVQWYDSFQNDLDKFLDSAKSVDSKIIVLYTEINDFDLNEVSKIIQDLEEEERDELKNSFEVVKDKKGETPFFELVFFHNNICFKFSELLEWMDDFLSIKQILEEHEDVENDVVFSSNRERRKELSEGDIDSIARELVFSDEYLNAQSYKERHAIMLKMFQKKSFISFYDRTIVERKCIEIYRNEVVSKREEEERLKVIELKKQGLKKVEIASKLGISAGKVNKYFYTD
jgi:hypothetical protein